MARPSPDKTLENARIIVTAGHPPSSLVLPREVGTAFALSHLRLGSFFPNQEGHAMSIYDRSGYIDAVLDSNDDYEPYGYQHQPGMQMVESAGGADDTRDRVIEAQLLAHWTMVGC